MVILWLLATAVVPEWPQKSNWLQLGGVQQQRGEAAACTRLWLALRALFPKQHLIIIITKRKAPRDTTVLHSGRGNCQAKHEL